MNFADALQNRLLSLGIFDKHNRRIFVLLTGNRAENFIFLTFLFGGDSHRKHRFGILNPLIFNRGGLVAESVAGFGIGKLARNDNITRVRHVNRNLFLALHGEKSAQTFLTFTVRAEKLICRVTFHIAADYANIRHPADERVNQRLENLSAEGIGNFAFDKLISFGINAAVNFCIGRGEKFDDAVEEFFHADIFKRTADEYRENFCLFDTLRQSLGNFFLV